MERDDQLADIQRNIELLWVENSRRSEMIQAICEQIDLLHEKYERLRTENRAEHDEMYAHHKRTEGIFDIFGEKLYQIYYKVFPEAIIVDDALEAARRSQKKKPEE